MEAHSVSSGVWPARHPFAGASLTPLSQAACLFALGIVIARFLWIPPSLLLIALVLLTCVCAVAAHTALRLAWMPVTVLWLLLGAWCAEMEPQPQPSPQLAALADGLLRTLTGTITSASPVRREVEQDVDNPAQARERFVQRVEVRLASLEVVTDTVDELQPIVGGVRLTVIYPAEPPHGFGCGLAIQADARPLPPEIYHDPGAWDREGYLAARGITATAAVEAAEIQIVPLGGRPRTLRSALDQTRCVFANAQSLASARLQNLPGLTARLPSPLRLSADDAAMLAAMITGDRSALTHALRIGFERTGSFHMLVVSGFHLAIVSGFLFWIARRLRMPRVPATLLTIVASFVYALFTGFATPVQRSLAMVVLYLIGRLFFRERSPLNVIGFASLCLLAARPGSLFDSGFQMTLLAVVSIAGIARPLLDGTVEPLITATRDLSLVAIDIKLPARQAQFRVLLRMFAQRLQIIGNSYLGWRAFPAAVRSVLRCLELVIISLVVELAMTLPMAIDFHRVTIVALPVNILILPLLLLLVPAALVTLLVLLVFPPAAILPAVLTSLLLHTGTGLVRVFGSVALADLRIATPPPWRIALFCVLLAVSVVIAGATRSRRVLSSTALVAAALCAIVPPPLKHPQDALLLEAIDVWQGDSLLLIGPDGKTMLVDGGGAGAGPFRSAQEFDIGEEVVSPALWARGIRRLDVVALTHAHADHLGGLQAVVRNFHPRALWVGNNPLVRPYADLLDEAARAGTPVRTLTAGDAVDLGAVHVSVLAPARSYVPGSVPANNDSLVMRASYQQASVLLEGDAETPVEQAMLQKGDLASTLLKVGHHGSVTSSSAAFLERVSPRWAVISCGLRNRYGHPRPEVLAALERAHILTRSTDVNGAVCFRLDRNGATPQAHCD